MRELIETESKEGEEGMRLFPLRQVDVNIGAGLALIGVLKSLLIAMTTTSGPNSGGIAMLALMLGLLLSAFLILAQLSPRQRGLTTGAALILLATVVSILVGMATNGIGVFILGPIFLLIIPFWVKLLHWFQNSFLASETIRKTPPAALPQPQQSINEIDLDTNRINEASPVDRFSVVEDSTSLLGTDPRKN